MAKANKELSLKAKRTQRMWPMRHDENKRKREKRTITKIRTTSVRTTEMLTGI